MSLIFIYKTNQFVLTQLILQMELENCAKNSAASLHSLFQFVQSIAHLWDIHEINMARKDREIEVIFL